MSETTQNKMTTLLPAPPPEINPWSQRPPSVKPIDSAIHSNVKTTPIKKELWPSTDQSAKENIREITKDSAVAPPVVKRGKEKWVPLKANIAIASPTNPKKGGAKSKGKKTGSNNVKSDSTTKKKSIKKARKPKEEDESISERQKPADEEDTRDESAKITSALQEIATAAEETVESPREAITEVPLGSEQTNPESSSPQEQTLTSVEDAANLPRNSSSSGRRNTYSNNGQRHHGYRTNSATNNNNGNFRRNSHSPSYGIPAIPQPYMGGLLPGAPFIPLNPYAASPVAFQYPQFVPMPTPGPKPKRGSRSNTESPSSTSSTSSPTPENIAMVPPQQFGIPPINYMDPSMYMSPLAANPYVQMYPSAPFVNDRVSQLGQQINYYFSTENLIKDFYLRKHMNSEGYVRVQFIEDFSRVRSLANGDHNLVVQAIRQNPQLELTGSGKDKKVRRKNEWDKWLLPKEQRDPSVKHE